MIELLNTLTRLGMVILLMCIVHEINDTVRVLNSMNIKVDRIWSHVVDCAQNIDKTRCFMESSVDTLQKIYGDVQYIADWADEIIQPCDRCSANNGAQNDEDVDDLSRYETNFRDPGRPKTEIYMDMSDWESQTGNELYDD